MFRGSWHRAITEAGGCGQPRQEGRDGGSSRNSIAGLLTNPLPAYWRQVHTNTDIPIVSLTSLPCRSQDPSRGPTGPQSLPDPLWFLIVLHSPHPSSRRAAASFYLGWGDTLVFVVPSARMPFCRLLHGCLPHLPWVSAPMPPTQ